MLFQDQQDNQKKKSEYHSRFKLLSASQRSQNKKLYQKMLSLGNQNQSELEKSQTFTKSVTKQHKLYKLSIIEAWPIQKLLNQTSKNTVQTFKNHIKSCARLKTEKIQYRKKKQNQMQQAYINQISYKTERTMQIGLRKDRLSNKKNIVKTQNIPQQTLIKFNDTLLNNYTKLSRRKNLGLQAYKCRTVGNQEMQNQPPAHIPYMQTDRIQIHGYKAPKAEILDHYKLKSPRPRQRPTVPFNNQKIFQSITNYT